MTARTGLARAGLAALASLIAGCASTNGARPSAALSESGALGVIAQTLLDSAATKYRRVAVSHGPAEWTSEFYPGTLWYLHEYTLDPTLRAQAERFTMPLAALAMGGNEADVALQMTGAFGNAYRVTRDERYRQTLLDAARRVAARDDTTRAARAWSGAAPSAPMLGETMSELELLAWGASRGGDTAWRGAAIRRGLLALAGADSATGVRDQAFAIHGFAALYDETREPRFLAAATQLADRTLARLPDDFVPCSQPAASGCTDDARRDAAAGAILASGLLELSTFVRGDDSVRFRTSAEQILGALTSSSYLAPNESPTLLGHEGSDRSGQGEASVYADYYLVEALLRFLQLSGQSGVRVLTR